MSDEELRDLERRFLESRSVADEAALLRAKCRQGAIRTDRLQIAAWCGHEAALLAAEDRAHPASLSAHVRQWLAAEDVDFHSPLPRDPLAALEVDTRVALAAIVAGAPPSTGEPRGEGEERVRASLERWILAGADPETVPSGRAIAEASVEFGPTDLLVRALQYPSNIADPEPGRTPQKEFDSYRARWASALDIVENRAPGVPLRVLVRGEVVFWALGYHDALAVRVAART